MRGKEHADYQVVDIQVVIRVTPLNATPIAVSDVLFEVVDDPAGNAAFTRQ